MFILTFLINVKEYILQYLFGTYRYLLVFFLWHNYSTLVISLWFFKLIKHLGMLWPLDQHPAIPNCNDSAILAVADANKCLHRYTNQLIFKNFHLKSNMCWSYLTFEFFIFWLVSIIGIQLFWWSFPQDFDNNCCGDYCDEMYIIWTVVIEYEL